MFFVRLAAIMRLFATRLVVLVANKDGAEFAFSDWNPSGLFETIFAFSGGVFAPGNDSAVFVVHEMFLGQTACSFVCGAVHNLRPSPPNHRVCVSGKMVHSVRTFFYHFY